LNKKGNSSKKYQFAELSDDNSSLCAVFAEALISYIYKPAGRTNNPSLY